MINADSTVQNAYVVTVLVKNGMEELAVQKVFQQQITKDDINATALEIKKHF